MQLTFKKISDALETVFKILLLIYAAMGTNSFTIQTKAISFVMWPCFALGAALIFNRVIHLKRYKTPYQWLLVALLAAACVSVVFNLGYELKKNIIFVILWAFYFLLLYIQPEDKGEDKIKREMKLIGGIFTVWIEICTIISVIMLFMGHERIAEVPTGELYVGIIFSRLYGVFTDPNLGAISVCLATLMLCYVMYTCKKLWVRLVLAVFVLLNIFYIALSDSRTGMVMLAVEAFVISATLLLRAFKEKVILKVCAVALSLVIAVFAAVVPSVVKGGYNQAVTAYLSTHTSDTEDFEQQEDKLTIDRDYDLSGDISNRRFSVWQSGIEIFASRFVVGTTYGGVKPYAQENLPETYLVNNDYMEMDTFDNEVINILVSNGILGFVPFILFVVCVLAFVIRYFVRRREKGFGFELMLFTGVGGIAAAAMFRSAIFYSNTTVANMFWIMLGALVALIQISKSSDCKEERV